MHRIQRWAPRRQQKGGVHFLHALLIAAFSIPALLPAELAIAQQFVPFNRRVPVAGQETAASGVYLPTDRSLSRAVTRARERLADREYHEALAFLQGILARDEDSFV